MEECLGSGRKRRKMTMSEDISDEEMKKNDKVYADPKNVLLETSDDVAKQKIALPHHHQRRRNHGRMSWLRKKA